MTRPKKIHFVYPERVPGEPHYAIIRIACGRWRPGLQTTVEPEETTCGSCHISHAFKEAQ